MEIMLETDIPTYAGGLGVLAGDLLRSCADKNIPAVGMSLVYSGNTFDQVISSDGTQKFKETHWKKMDQLTRLPNQISIYSDGTEIKIGLWRYDIVGINGFVVPVYLLDTDLPQNSDWAKNITKSLYQGGNDIRILQELVLGIGGVRMLRDLGYSEIETFHLNEGHAAFVSLELLKEFNYDLEKVKKHLVFTTHTPVPEGHDSFNYEVAYKYLGDYLPWNIKELATDQSLHMTHLALNTSKVSFGVSEKHEQVSRSLFPNKEITHITNGVHPRTWISPSFQSLYDTHIPQWQTDPKVFDQVPNKISSDSIWQAHLESKKELLNYVNKHLTSVISAEEVTKQDIFDIETLTISLARRPVEYKRPLLLYSDLERFIRIGVGKIQIIQCGKSHPDDDVSQSFVREIVRISKRLKTILRIVYLENYSPKIARMLVSGSDIWLNTPRRPLEASGTSGMKAALNGVINFSVLDGWWIEGYKMNQNSGFSIGGLYDGVTPINDDQADADSLYSTLEHEIIPMYYNHRATWIEKMKNSITLGSYFNTNRCIDDYKKVAWNK